MDLQRNDTSLHYLRKQPGGVRLVVGGTLSEQFVQRQAKGKEIATGVGSARESLRSGVTQRASHLAGTGEILLFEDLGQAEIGDPQCTLMIEQQVGRLDIAMQDALSVRIGQRLGRLHAEPGDEARQGDNERGDPFGQRLALDELHHVIMLPLVLADAENRDDVGMVQSAGRAVPRAGSAPPVPGSGARAAGSTLRATRRCRDTCSAS